MCFFTLLNNETDLIKKNNGKKQKIMKCQRIAIHEMSQSNKHSIRISKNREIILFSQLICNTFKIVLLLNFFRFSVSLFLWLRLCICSNVTNGRKSGKFFIAFFVHFLTLPSIWLIRKMKY